MTGTEAVILGIIQGITEFLACEQLRPSGFCSILLDLHGSHVYDLLLHVSTMIATLIYFRRDLAQFDF